MEGGDGADDIYVGHNIWFGEDMGNVLKGGGGGDVIFGNNSQIVRGCIKSKD